MLKQNQKYKIKSICFKGIYKCYFTSFIFSMLILKRINYAVKEYVKIDIKAYREN